MRRTGKSKPSVWRWQERYLAAGVDGLAARQDAAGTQETAVVPGEAPGADQDDAAAAERHALEHAQHGQGGRHHSHERAAHLGGGRLKPHLTRTFKVSNDPRFAEKVADVVGLYLNPPDKALVLCVDEKSQIQALDRTQPGLPMKKGRAATMTHDYKRNGTTTLFAALDVKTGEVIGECQPRHRAKEFLRFLRTIDRTVAKYLDLHLIVDNYTTHKTKAVKAWLAKHPRFKLHFIPPRRPGSTWWSASSPRSRARRSGVASSRASRT